MIQTRGWNSTRKGSQFLFERPTSILIRGILIEPKLHLAFDTKEDAERAYEQHICLCRNEDILMPFKIIEIVKSDFDDEVLFNGYELVFEKNEDSFQVGYHRVTNEPMFGWLKIVGNPINNF